jgi:hypothetical protein
MGLILKLIHRKGEKQGSGIATGYGLDGRGVGVRLPVGERFFSSPRSPERLWGPPSLLTNRYRGLFHGGKVVAG